MYICLIELLNNINDMKIRKGKKDDLPVILELIKELADYENALDEVKVTLEQLEDDGFGRHPHYWFLVAEDNNNIIGMNKVVEYEKNHDNYILINCLPINVSQDSTNMMLKNIIMKNIELLIDVNYTNNFVSGNCQSTFSANNK